MKTSDPTRAQLLVDIMAMLASDENRHAVVSGGAVAHVIALAETAAAPADAVAALCIIRILLQYPSAAQRFDAVF
jgi:hypothetical protein